MAEDGMLVNLSFGEGLLNAKPVFRGGRWKDRLLAKKRAHGGPRKARNEEPAFVSRTAGGASSSADEQTTRGDTESERPLKRPKLTNNYNAPVTSGSSKGPKEVISSLFSFNPPSKVPTEHSAEDPTPVQPSNAPLIDGLDTFTSLGLSPTLAAHLLTKLNLKAPTAIQKATISQLIREDSDAFIQGETGSGKTLAYLLPIVQRIMEFSTSAMKGAQSNGDGRVRRRSGLFAIILAPTRELCKQISVVLDGLLRCAHWIVAGTVIGGEKKKSEKARLRKGLNILVATPGRLADHLSNTKVLDGSKVRWLVLDEGDRLMELGFEEEVLGIIKKLDDKNEATKVGTVPGLPGRKMTILCSATLKMNVQRLGENSLRDAIHIKAEPEDLGFRESTEIEERPFSMPAQLKQSYVIVPAKQRLVALAAYLRRAFSRQGAVTKAIVFISCADSVDFHFNVFARQASLPQADESHKSPEDSRGNAEESRREPSSSGPKLSTIAPATFLGSPHNSDMILYKLHGSLTQPVRTSTLSAFSRSQNPSILFCTDVASRGLDLPKIDLIIEYDPPFSADDHLHRIGRTARAGNEGRAVIFLMPGEEEDYIDILKQGYRDGIGKGLTRNDAKDVLEKGFGAVGKSDKANNVEWEEAATEWQLSVERWAADDKNAGEMAKRAFISHIRAYATHVAKEREIFNVRALHLGHLAKAFALRDRPGNLGRAADGRGKAAKRIQGSQKQTVIHGGSVSSRNLEQKPTRTDAHQVPATGQDIAQKMRSKLKEHMAAASEFNIG
ncbi:ATP-dependent RNA helicase dbp7 [Loxospora ochrophaea]|nr:ATP-dependent RNA helicase dbp7 [Loxospora ochrophaea]